MAQARRMAERQMKEDARKTAASRNAARQMEFAPVVGTARFAAHGGEHAAPYRVASLFAGCGGLDLGFVGGFAFLGKRYPRIQSFPDSFVFPCGIRETERQIGNAVPPVLAWYVAKAVMKALEGGHDEE